jgi:hypothetical protein
LINENNIGDRERFDKEYLKIIDLINKEEFNQVQIILNNYNLKDYALWNYVYALFRHEQGWMNDAYGHYKRAYKLEPNNRVYHKAYVDIFKMRYHYFDKKHIRNIGCVCCGLVSCGCCVGCCVKYVIPVFYCAYCLHDNNLLPCTYNPDEIRCSGLER